jgi:hypothetical protein
MVNLSPLLSNLLSRFIIEVSSKEHYFNATQLEKVNWLLLVINLLLPLLLILLAKPITAYFTEDFVINADEEEEDPTPPSQP